MASVRWAARLHACWWANRTTVRTTGMQENFALSAQLRADARRKTTTKDIDGVLRKLSSQLEGRVSTQGDEDYKAAIAIWAKPVGRQPRVIVHCRSPQD